ncbi:MAG: FAD/NAD(P)-binding protein [Candidatus Acidiferrales bacterium]
MKTTPEGKGIAGISHPMAPSPFRVARSRRETRDTYTLELVPTDGSKPAPFTAGQFNMVYVFGVGEVPMSITGDPGKPDTIVHTTRSVGAVSAAICKLRRGDMVGIRGPFGSSWPVQEAAGKDVIVVAGGVGLAPLRPAFYRILADRTKYGKVTLICGSRSPIDILFQDELEKWRSRLDLSIEVTVDRAPTSWKGSVGVVTTLIPKVSFDPRNVTAMVCGPEVMMRFVARDLESRGVEKKQIYISMERNMKCAVGFCGHCQFGPQFICKDGPVFRYDRIAPQLLVREI